MSATVTVESNASTMQAEFPKNAWYAIAPSAAIKQKPVGLRRLGIELVLWRDEAGELVAQSRHCPHRGVDLALGQVKNNCLECPYHGFQFAPEGQCVAMPCEGESAKISSVMRVERYPTQEVHDLIWLWWGDRQPDALPWFAELPDAPKRWADGEMTFDIPFTRAAESALIDLHHVAFTHTDVAKLMGMDRTTQLSFQRVETIDNRIFTEGTLHSPDKSQQAIAFSHELVFPNLAMFDFNMWGMVLFVSLTPIDENNSWAYFRYYGLKGWPWLARAIAKASCWFELKFVQPDDYRLVKSSQPQQSDLTTNRFVPADKTIVHWHRLYRQRLTKQRANSKERLTSEKTTSVT